MRRAPYDVAVVGVDNDELLCGLSSPPLTSVEQGARQLGYAAASLLDRILDGEGPERREHIIDPLGVVARQSTHAFAVAEPYVSKAMTFIYQHAGRQMRVSDVVRAAGGSRSTLEGRFRATLHCTIGTVMRRVQIERVRRLLSETGAPLKEVAFESGFKSVQHMTTASAKAYGLTPGRYRRLLTL